MKMKYKLTNRIISLVLALVMVLGMAPVTQPVEAVSTPTYITSLGIAQGNHESDAKNELSGHTIIDYDLNKGCGGSSDYIYMGYKTTTDPSKAITGIFIRTGQNPPNSATFDGVTAYLVGGSSEANTAVDNVVDLNTNAGGSYIYVYVTRDSSRAPVTEITFSSSNSKSGYTTPNVDLNEGCGKGTDYIYLHYKQFSATLRADYYLNSNGSRISGYATATVKNHLETLTKAPSVTTSVTYSGNTYTFQGWREDDTAAGATTTSPSVTYMTTPKTYRAVYSRTSTLSYDANGGTGAPSAQTATQYLNAGSSSVTRQSVPLTVSSTVPTYADKCYFLGWSGEMNGSPFICLPGYQITIDKDTTLVANWNDHIYVDNVCANCSKIDPSAGVVASLSKNGKVVCAYTALGEVITAAQKCTASDKAEVTILQNIDLGSNPQLIESGVFTLDLNGFEIKASSGCVLRLDGSSVNVTLRDSGETGVITGKYAFGIIAKNGSTLTISSGTISAPARETGVSITDSTVIINGGTINGGFHGVYSTGGTVTISDGIIKDGGNSDGVCCDNGTLTISGGTITSNDAAVFARGASKVTISGGTFIGKHDDLYSYEGGTIKLTVGADGTGATFPDNLRTSYYGKQVYLDYLLDTDCAYWVGDTMLSVSNNACSITDKGDITVKKVCTDHVEGTAATCIKQAVCSLCNASYGEVNKANHDENAVYENGFCISCDIYQPAVLNGDVYEISNAGQLYWFAAKVNGGEYTINGKLMAPITVNAGAITEETTDARDWSPIGTNGKGYQGTFDGQGYTISGLYNNSDASNIGLFCAVVKGTVKNVGVINSWFSGNDTYSYVGGITAFLSSGTVQNCWNTATVRSNYCAGGIVSDNIAGSVVNCYNAGAVTGRQIAGGVVGKNEALITSDTVTNCYNTGVISGSSTDVGGVVGVNKNTVTNCYYNTAAYSGSAFGQSNGTVTKVEGRTAEQFTSGEVCYLLNGDQSDLVWYQTCGEGSPLFSGNRVYRLTEGDGTYLYSNALETYVCQVDGADYYRLQNACNGANGNIVTWLQDTDQSATVTTNVILDLNGFDITGTLTVTTGALTGMDSTATKTAAGNGSVKITGNVVKDQIIDGVRYVALENDGVYTFHVLEMKLKSVSLRPSAAGIYYRAVVECDPVLAAATGSHGIALSVRDMPGTDFEEQDSYTVTAGAPVSGQLFNSGSVFGIFKEGLENNADRGKVKVYANAYLKLTDGTVLMTDGTFGDKITDEGFDGVALSLQDVMGKLNEKFADLTEAQQKSLKDFYATWETAMSDWGLSNLANITES